MSGVSGWILVIYIIGGNWNTAVTTVDKPYIKKEDCTFAASQAVELGRDAGVHAFCIPSGP